MQGIWVWRVVDLVVGGPALVFLNGPKYSSSRALFFLSGARLLGPFSRFAPKTVSGMGRQIMVRDFVLPADFVP